MSQHVAPGQLPTWLNGLVERVGARAFTHPPRRVWLPLVPRSLARRYDVTVTEHRPGRVVLARPRSGPSAGRAAGHLFFLHGGAYTMPPFHWPFLTGFLDAGWSVSMVDYPLAPEHTVDETVPMVLDAWRTASATGPLALAGDSAGGGLALVLLQQLRDLGLPMPTRSVLLSPWVDLVMDDDATVAESKRDPVLSLSGLHGAARLYAGERDVADPLLSPLRGELDRLGEIQAWVGTREMFLPQCQLLADRAAPTAGTNLELRLGHGRVHDWALLPGRARSLLTHEMLDYLGRSAR